MIERAFQALLRLYPAAFRHRFADEMTAAFEQEVAAARAGGRLRLIRLGLRTLAETSAFALAEHVGAVQVAPSPPSRYSRKGDGWMSSFIADLRYAMRRMTRSPGFTILVVLTLALGIGVNTAIFSLVDTVLLRPLPFEDPDRLVRIWSAHSERGERFLDATIDEVRAIGEQNRSFTHTAAFSLAPRDLHDEAGTPREVLIARVSAGFWEVVGAHPALGRDFLAEEYQAGAPAVLLSHALWQSRYGGQLDIVGRRVHLQGVPHTVVGVMPATSGFPQQAVLWRPFTHEENADDDRELQALARLRPGVGYQEASAEVALILSRMEPIGDDAAVMTGWVQPLQAMLVGGVQKPFWMLLAAVLVVLAIACANVASLQLARGVARRQEVAVRTALGAERGRLTAQIVTENIVLAVLGGLAGLVLGGWLIRLLVMISPAGLPRLAEVRLDLRIAVVMMIATTAAGLFCGLIPAFQATRGKSGRALHGTLHGQDNLAGGRHRLQQAFVIGQVALATMLVLGAALLATTFLRHFHADRGFATDNVMTLGISPPRSRDGAAEQRIAFYEEAETALSTLPGVEGAAMTNFHPMQDYGFRMSFEILGQGTGGESHQALLRSVTPGFFRTAGIALKSGRDLGSDDSHGVAVVNEAFARAFLGGAAPVGQRLVHPAFGDGLPVEHTIVGVVGDVQAAAAGDVKPQIYLPYRQLPWPRMTLLLRFQGDPATVAAAARARIWEIDPTIPVDDVLTMEQLIVRSIATQQFNTRLTGTFAALALALAALGIYGVVSCVVVHRTREIGLRVALGAERGSIIGMVIGRGLALSLTGVAFGLLGSLWATRFLASLLFGVRPMEPGLLVMVAVGLAAVATLASALPARRAVSIDPVRALRAE